MWTQRSSSNLSNLWLTLVKISWSRDLKAPTICHRWELKSRSVAWLSIASCTAGTVRALYSTSVATTWYSITLWSDRSEQEEGAGAAGGDAEQTDAHCGPRCLVNVISVISAFSCLVIWKLSTSERSIYEGCNLMLESRSTIDADGPVIEPRDICWMTGCLKTGRQSSGRLALGCQTAGCQAVRHTSNHDRESARTAITLCHGSVLNTLHQMDITSIRTIVERLNV